MLRTANFPPGSFKFKQEKMKSSGNNASESVRQAYEIAKRDLRSNYRKNGILAGHNQFSDFWARDFSFASFGAMRLKDYVVVRRGLENFLRYQKPNGFLPFLIGPKHFLMKYIGFKVKKRVPTYGDHKSKAAVVDQNSLIIIAAMNYVRESKDIGFAKRHFNELKKAVDWSMSRDIDDDFLIEEHYFANWADSVKKTGKVLYSNVCFYKSVLEFSELCKLCDHQSLYVEYADIVRKIKESINAKFWNGRYYIDWIFGKKKYDFFATDGNMLAIMWGVADNYRTGKIIEHAAKVEIDYPVPCKTNHPRYPARMESNLMWLIFLGDYHNASLAWLWLGACLAVAKKKAGLDKEAAETLERMAEIINRYNMVYEVYETNGRPVKRMVYKSDIHFAWSSGMFIYAVNEVCGNQEKS